jgi:phosphatidylglycerol---prolipoprotein diacylglyceryl transferase
MHKVACSLGGLTIYWYGVLVALGFLAGLWTASRRAPRHGLRAETILDAGPWLLLGAVVGSRALYVINNWQADFAGKPFWNILNLRQGGLVFYGGLIGAALATLLYLRLKKLPIWKVADALAPSIALGAFFGRLGCFMNGCCYGRPTDLPWAVHFPPDHDTKGAGVHPVQLYDALCNLALYAGLAWLYRRKRFDGQVMAVHLMCYALLRSFVELFRNDYGTSDYFLAGWLTPAQFISVGILTAGALLYWNRWQAAQPKA